MSAYLADSLADMRLNCLVPLNRHPLFGPRLLPTLLQSIFVSVVQFLLVLAYAPMDIIQRSRLNPFSFQ